MNKKSQFLTLGIIIAILLVTSFVIIQEKIENKYGVVNYVGDTSINKVYYLKNTNPDCDLDKIVIYQNDIVYFKSLTEAQGFELDENCRENN